MVSVLINHPKCNINEKDGLGSTALHWGEYLNIFKLIVLFILSFKASESGHQRIVDLITQITRTKH